MTEDDLMEILDAHQDIMDDILKGCERLVDTVRILSTRIERLENKDE